MAANNALVEEEDTVKDDEDDDLGDDPAEADSAIQAHSTRMFTSLIK